MYSRPPLSFLFFFNDTATTEIYTLSLHDALPISIVIQHPAGDVRQAEAQLKGQAEQQRASAQAQEVQIQRQHQGAVERSEEHTSELQSPCNLVCRLLLEKKNSTNSGSPMLHTYHL